MRWRILHKKRALGGELWIRVYSGASTESIRVLGAVEELELEAFGFGCTRGLNIDHHGQFVSTKFH